MGDLSWMRPKLAELCGLTVDSERFRIGPTYMHGKDPVAVFDDWRPDEDVAQAVRCMEALPQENFKRIDYQHGRWGVGIWNGTIGGHRFGQDQSFPRAICLAISQAMGWTEEAAERGER